MPLIRGVDEILLIPYTCPLTEGSQSGPAPPPRRPICQWDLPPPVGKEFCMG